MAGPKIKLDHRGLSAILKSRGITEAVREAADVVAGNVRAQGIKVGDKDGGSSEVELPVRVSMYETDRAHAVVSLAHPAGDNVQAKHGSLTKAAAEAGLDVHAG